MTLGTIIKSISRNMQHIFIEKSGKNLNQEKHVPYKVFLDIFQYLELMIRIKSIAVHNGF